MEGDTRSSAHPTHRPFCIHDLPQTPGHLDGSTESCWGQEVSCVNFLLLSANYHTFGELKNNKKFIILLFYR